jgi:hypothetical protein
MRILCCLAIVPFILAAPAVWAADPSPAAALADPDMAFRTPEGEALPGPKSETSPTSLPAGSPGSPTPGFMGESQLFRGTQAALTDAASLQLAQAGGTAAPVSEPARESNPWIFGATIYFWVPFATSDSTIDGLPEVHKSTFSNDTHVTNLIGGAAEFTLSKGDWGLFGNIAGSTVGYKGTLVREDPRFPTREDRSGYFHDAGISGQYGLSYRLLGRPLDLSPWAHGTQPLSLDLLAGAQTLYASSSVSTQRVQMLVSTTLTSPLVGTRLSWDLADRWNLGLGGSVGGFNVSDTHLTWQVDLSVAYRFLMGSVPGALTLAFRVQGLNFETGSDATYFKLNETLYGPMLGFSMFF